MPGQIIPLTDEELGAIDFKQQPDLMAKLTSDERRRLSKIKPERTWTDTAVDALPTVGGALGGIVGGIGGTAFGMGVGGMPGAVGGAAVGGVAGEGLRQTINAMRGKPLPTLGGQVTDLAKEGAVQGASELAGAGVMKGGSMAAHGLMDFAIRPSPTIAKEFGDIAGAALKERIPVGSMLPGGAKGSNLAQRAIRDSAGTTRGLLKTAEAAGETIAPEALARGPVSEMAGNIAKQPLSESELQQVSRMFSEYLETHPGNMAPAAVKDMKQAAQRIARPIFKAINAGNVPAAGDALKAQFNKAVADGAKESLEALPRVGKAVAASESRTQGLIGVNKAVRQAEVRRLPLLAEMAAPIAGAAAAGASGGNTQSAGKGITAAVLVRAMLSPRATSRVALGLTTPAIQQALRQMPRAAVLQLLEQVTGTDQSKADTPPERRRQ